MRWLLPAWRAYPCDLLRAGESAGDSAYPTRSQDWLMNLRKAYGKSLVNEGKFTELIHFLSM